jgi:hypothetical protein
VDRRTFLKLGAGAGAALSPLGAALAQEKSGFTEVTDEQVKAVTKGLDWLSRNQGRSGAVGQSCQVAFTGLAGLAWLAGGNTPTRGKYATNVKNALKFILRCTPKSGYINEAAGRGMGGSGMHGHGYALLFLCELYGMCGDVQDDTIADESVKEKIAAAVKCTEGSQDPSGGWTYDPSPNGHEGSVTITQVEALRAARNIGISVKKTTIEKGIGYIKKSTAADGTIMYSLGGGGGGTYALTAAGACVYAMYGLYDTPEAKKCMKALFNFLKGGASQNGFDSYSQFYASQACFFMKGQDSKFWTEGYDKVRKAILQSQDKGSGAWLQDGYGGGFGTACACLALQIPYRFLPIFQD